jgi:hypothetical protein
MTFRRPCQGALRCGVETGGVAFRSTTGYHPSRLPARQICMNSGSCLEAAGVPGVGGRVRGTEGRRRIRNFVPGVNPSHRTSGSLAALRQTCGGKRPPKRRAPRRRPAAAAALECGGLPPLSFRLTEEFRTDWTNHPCHGSGWSDAPRLLDEKRRLSRRTPKRASRATPATQHSFLLLSGHEPAVLRSHVG